jgi:hypothetical protein
VLRLETSASTFQLVGAGCFGAVIGWFLYYVNRYRREVVLTDLATVIAAIGGGAVLALFPAKTDLFAAYAVGLAIGFFAYLAVLIVFVAISETVTVDWFLGVPPAGAPDAGRAMEEKRDLGE